MLLFDELKSLCKLHIVTKHRFEACRKKLGEKLGPEKREKGWSFEKIGNLGCF